MVNTEQLVDNKYFVDLLHNDPEDGHSNMAFTGQIGSMFGFWTCDNGLCSRAGGQ